MRRLLPRTAMAVLALAALLINATPARAYTIYYNLHGNEADRRDGTLKHITVWVLKEPDDFGRMLRAIGHSNKNVDRWVNLGKVVAVQGASGALGVAAGVGTAVGSANPVAAAVAVGMVYAVASVGFSVIGEAAGGPIADTISKARRDDMRAKYTLEIESINPGEYWGKIGNEKRGKVYIVITAAGANSVPIAQFWLDNTESAVITTSRDNNNGQLETFVATSPSNPNFPLPGDFTKAEWDAKPRDERLKIRANEEQKRMESRNAYLAWKKQQKK